MAKAKEKRVEMEEKKIGDQRSRSEVPTYDNRDPLVNIGWRDGSWESTWRREQGYQVQQYR